MKIFITGGFGKTAEPLIDLLLNNNHSVIVLDTQKDNGRFQNQNFKSFVGDICDDETVCKAMDSADAVIHLAVNITDNEDSFLSFQTNVFGTFNVLNQANKHNVKKVLLASSAPVHNLENLLVHKIENQNADYLCSSGEDFTYDLTKNIQELIAKNFAQTYAMNNLVLRLGHIVDGHAQTDLHGNPLSQLTYCRGGWVCRYDVAMAFLKAVESDFCGFHLLNVIGSYQSSENFDLSIAKKLISFNCSEHFINY